jgi:hypothetical protein
MSPPGWRESVTGETTTFRFHGASNFRRIAFTIVLAPLSLLAFSMTAASIREANWGSGYVCVGGFDLLALFGLLLIVMQFNRTRVVIEQGHVTWDDGPILRTRTRMTYAEAATIAASMKSSRRTIWYSFTFTRDGQAKLLGTSLDDQGRALFVIGRIDAEMKRRALTPAGETS